MTELFKTINPLSDALNGTRILFEAFAMEDAFVEDGSLNESFLGTYLDRIETVISTPNAMRSVIDKAADILASLEIIATHKDKVFGGKHLTDYLYSTPVMTDIPSEIAKVAPVTLRDRSEQLREIIRSNQSEARKIVDKLRHDLNPKLDDEVQGAQATELVKTSRKP